jgi:hypothetical protein
MLGLELSMLIHVIISVTFNDTYQTFRSMIRFQEIKFIRIVSSCRISRSNTAGTRLVLIPLLSYVYTAVIIIDFLLLFK